MKIYEIVLLSETSSLLRIQTRAVESQAWAEWLTFILSAVMSILAIITGSHFWNFSDGGLGHKRVKYKLTPENIKDNLIIKGESKSGNDAKDIIIFRDPSYIFCDVSNVDSIQKDISTYESPFSTGPLFLPSTQGIVKDVKNKKLKINGKDVSGQLKISQNDIDKAFKWSKDKVINKYNEIYSQNRFNDYNEYIAISYITRNDVNNVHSLLINKYGKIDLLSKRWIKIKKL